MTGILLIDKPSGMTSHDVVDHVRKAAGIRKVGHTGTLDPAATGLLILCLGRATKLSDFFVGLDKTYEGNMLLGTVTDSYDMDGNVLETNEVPEITDEQIQSAFEEFTGDIEQIPPMVSAVKVGGKRLYKLARKGETVEREPRPVSVYEFSLLHYEKPNAAFRLKCSRGTYARALCHDVGAMLGCGGALSQLRRTQVGPHSIEKAVALDSLKTPEDVTNALLPMEQALTLPRVAVRSFSERLISCGNAIGRPDLEDECPVTEGWVQLCNERGKLLALGQVSLVGSTVRIQPKKVLDNKK